MYGSLGPEGAFSETTPYAPNSPYSASKAASDHFVRAYHHTYGLPTLMTNCSNNYGPFQFPEKLIPLMILNALEGKPLPVYGDGQQVRDWLFVEDHCRAIRRVLASGKPGETYNIGGNCERTNLSIVEAICAAVDDRLPELRASPCRSLITFVKDRPGHDRRYAIDAEQDPPRAGLAARAALRVRPVADRRLVSGQPSLGRARHLRLLSTRTTGAALSERIAHEHNALPQRHHPGRRLGHAAVSGHAGGQQAIAAGLRQADDLLSAVDVDAGRHPRDPGDLDAAGHRRLRAAAGRRPPAGHSTFTTPCSPSPRDWRRRF